MIYVVQPYLRKFKEKQSVTRKAISSQLNCKSKSSYKVPVVEIRQGYSTSFVFNS